MIIIEGMDNSGKTTLADQLGELFRIPVVHSEKPKDEADYKKSVDELLRSRAICIRDRHCCLSEAVYGPAIRGKSLADGSHAEDLWLLSKRQPLIIWAHTSLATVLKTLGDREQMDGVVQKATDLHARYERLMLNVQRVFSANPEHSGVIMYDWTQAAPNVAENSGLLSRINAQLDYASRSSTRYSTFHRALTSHGMN